MLENPEFRQFVKDTLGLVFTEENVKAWDPPTLPWMDHVYERLQEAWKVFTGETKPEIKHESKPPEMPKEVVLPVVRGKRRFIDGKWVETQDPFFF